MSVGRNADNSLAIIAHDDSRYRASERDYWRRLRARLSDPRIELVDYNDRYGSWYARLQRTLDRGTVASLACARTEGSPVCLLSIDAHFVNLVRAEVRAVTLWGLLERAHGASRIPESDLIEAKARLAAHGWQSQRIGVGDFYSAFDKVSEPEQRDVCIWGFLVALRAFKVDEALRIAVKVLNRKEARTLKVFGRSLAALFAEALPPASEFARRAAWSKHRSAVKSWYKGDLVRWRDQAK